MDKTSYSMNDAMRSEGMRGVVRRLDEELGLMPWPEVEPVEDIVIGPADCLVTAMGFEDRAVAGIERACEGSRGFHVGLVRYLPEMEENRDRQFLEVSRAHGLHVRQFTYDRKRPAGMGLEVADYAASFDKVYVDISGMSRLLIVQTLVALIERGKECEIVYSEAEVYPPLEREYDEAHVPGVAMPSFVSSGIFEVASSPELSSVAMLGSPIRLISFLSFDPSQLSNLVQEIQPTHNNVVKGRSPRLEMAWRTEAVDRLNATTVTTLQGVKVHEACTFDYRQTLKMIVELYGMYSAFDRIVIAPTGSKMQAVAIGIVRGVLADLQIVYPTPREFLEPSRYTEGVKQVFRVPVRCLSAVAAGPRGNGH